MSNSISENIGKLTQPITKLIEVTSNAVSKIYEPYHAKKMSKANIMVKSYDKIGDLISNEIEERGLRFFIEQLGKKQTNIEKIIQKSIGHLPLENTQSTINPDESWLLDFFDLSQNCTDEQIQEIWAKILADEIDKPESHTRRLMHFLKLMEPNEAKFFKMISECRCEFYCIINDDYPQTNKLNNTGVLIAIENEIIFGEHLGFEYNYEKLIHLVEIGLFKRINFWNEEADELYVEKIVFNNKEIKVKNAVIEFFEFTTLGLELMEVCKPNLNIKYFEIMLNELKNRKMIRE